MDQDLPRQAKKASAIVEAVCGEKVIASYLFGSAVVGGLHPDSDVDVLVAVDGQLFPSERQRLGAQLMAVSGKMTGEGGERPLEVTMVDLGEVVPWRYPPMKEFQYGEWLRERFVEDGVPEPESDPDLAIVLSQVRERSVRMRGPSATELFNEVPWRDVRSAMSDSLPSLIAGFQGDERNVLLTLCRMWVTSEIGGFVPKDVAADWALERLPANLGRLLELARAGYRGEREDNWAGLEKELEELAAVLSRAIKAPREREETIRSPRSGRGAASAN